MKFSKKIVTAIVAITMCATSAASLTSCKKHQHSFGEWQLTTPPTCTEDGLETRSCADCDDKEERVVDKLNHNYGEWQLVKLPTAYSKGEAVKVCANDAEHQHDLIAALPALTKDGTGYKSVVKDAKTKITTYTFDYDGDNVVFSTYGVFSAKDAIEASLQTKSEVVGGTIKIVGTTRYDAGTANSNINSSYEYGDNYIHIVDGEMNNEKWYTKNEDGTIFAAYSFYDREHNRVIGKATFDDIEESFDGYGFGYINLMDADKAYGLESFINYLYTKGAKNPNGDFKESINDVEKDGVTVRTYKFSYGVPDTEFQRLHTVSVEFTLDDKYAVNSAVIEFFTYSNLGSIGDGQYEDLGILKESNGKYTVVSGKEENWRATEKYTITQRSELKEGESKPTNPYNLKDMKATSFDFEKVSVNAAFEVTKDLGAVTDTLNMTPTESVALQLRNIKPSTTNFYFDEVKLYNRITKADGTKQDIELTHSYNGGSDGNIQATFDPVVNLVIINCYVAGEFDLVIKTENVEKVIHINVPYVKPTGFAANVYVYDEIAEKGMWNNVTPTYSVYEGQALKFNAYVNHAAYEESGYTVTVKDANGTDVTEDVLSDDYIEGRAVKVFNSDAAGTYTVTLTSAYDSDPAITSEITVYVNEAPEVSEVFDDGYASDDEEVAVMFDWGSKTAVITNGTGDDAKVTHVTFEYDEDSRVATTTYVSGADDYEYTFNLSEAYNLYVEYTNEFGLGAKVRIIKDGSIKNNLVGTHTIANNMDDAEYFEVNVSGVYRVTLGETTTSMWFHQKETDERPTSHPIGEGDDKSGKTTTFKLLEGEKIRFWDASGCEYTISYERNVILATGVTLDKTTADMTVGGDTLSLKAVYNPENADFKSGSWTSSDKEVATVDALGVVTALKSGTATITYKSAVGNFTATCTVNVTYVNLTGVELNKTSVELIADDNDKNTVELKVICTPANASDKTGEWKSSNTQIAYVDQSGKVYARGDGTATITFTSNEGNFTATCEVTVIAKKVTGVTLNEKASSLVVGSTKTLVATVSPASAENKAVTWKSSDETIATVDANGTVTALKVGQVIITVTTDDGKYTATCTISVAEKEIEVESVSISGGKPNLYTGEYTKLTAYIEPSNAANKSVIWSSSDENVATVDENGIVTAVGEGTATITVTSANGKTATYKVTVTDLRLFVGGAVSVGSYIIPEDKQGIAGTWSSSDEGVVTVNQDGVVTAVSGGSATISVVIEGQTYSIPVGVYESTALTQDKYVLHMKGSSSITFTYAVKANTSYRFSVSDGGKFEGKDGNSYYEYFEEDGIATFTVVADKTDPFAKFNLAVKELPPVTGVTLNKTSLEIETGGFGELLNATLSPTDGNPTLVWSSSDTSVATVSEGGRVMGISGGTATITVTTVNGKTATCEVTVTVANALQVGNNEITAQYSGTETYVLVGGEPNTEYKFSVVGATMYNFYPIVNGEPDRSSSDNDSPITLTTDAKGSVSVALQVYGVLPATGITVAKPGEGPIDPGPDDPDNPTYETDAESHFILVNLGENKGLTLDLGVRRLTFRGKPNTQYVFTIADGDGATIKENDRNDEPKGDGGNPLTLTTAADGRVDIRVIWFSAPDKFALTVEKVYKVDAESEYRVIEVGDSEEVELTTAANQKFFTVQGTAGASYKITITGASGSVYLVRMEKKDGGYMDTVDGTLTTDGAATYKADTNGKVHFRLMAFSDDKFTVTVEKVDAESGYPIINLGENSGIKLDGDSSTFAFGKAYFTFIGEADASYKFTVVDATGVYIAEIVGFPDDTGESGSDQLTLTADAKGKVHIRLGAFAKLTFTLKVEKVENVEPPVDDSKVLELDEAYEVTEDDTSSGGVFKMQFTAPEAGDYVITVTDVSGYNEIVYGWVTINGEKYGDGSATVTKKLTLNAGEKVSITAEQSELSFKVTKDETPTPPVDNTVTVKVDEDNSVTVPEDGLDVKIDVRLNGSFKLSSPNSGVMFIYYRESGNPITVDYNAGDTIKVMVNGASGSTDVIINVEEAEVDDGIELIEEPGEYGSDTEADYYSALIYKLVVGAGESYSVAAKDNELIVVGQLNSWGDDVEEDESLDLTDLTEGTYYIALFAGEESDTNAWFTVTKN